MEEIKDEGYVQEAGNEEAPEEVVEETRHVEDSVRGDKENSLVFLEDIIPDKDTKKADEGMME
jgi:hypothetical protein